MKQPNPQKIGIIGGAGVAATNLLNTRVEEYFTRHGAFRDCRHPEIITVQATQVPSRSMYLEGRGESFVPGYVEIARALVGMGAGTLCMNCNTAHYAYDDIAASVEPLGARVINLVEEVVKRCMFAIESKKLPRKVGILASDGSVLAKVYDKYFRRHAPEIEIVYPDSDFQKIVTLAICNAKNAARFLPLGDTSRPKNLVKKAFLHIAGKCGNGGGIRCRLHGFGSRFFPGGTSRYADYRFFKRVG